MERAAEKMEYACAMRYTISCAVIAALISGASSEAAVETFRGTAPAGVRATRSGSGRGAGPSVAQQLAARAKKEEKAFDFAAFKHDLKRKIRKALQHNMELNGVVDTPEGLSAFINNKIVKVGDVVDGATVLRIDRKETEVMIKGRKVILKLAY